MGNDAHLHSNFTAWPSVNNYELLQRPQYKVWRDIKTQTETYEEYDVRIQDETHLNQYKAMWLLRSNY